MEIISTAIAYMAGYNIRLLPIIQSMAQLDAVYGKDVSRTMITNHALQIVYAPREQQDANDYSEMLGYTTIRKRNRSRSYGQQGNTTLSEHEERRALMLPQELKALGNDREVFFYEGIPHPVLCEKIKYYKDKHFTSRLLPKVKIKPLQIGDGPMPNKVQDTISAVATLALAACAVQPVATTSAQAAPQEISQTAQAALSESAAPKNPAEALGQKLLKLIDSLKTIDDLTAERIDEAMGVNMQKDPDLTGSFSHRSHLDEHWSYRLEYEENGYLNNPQLDVKFENDGNTTTTPRVCLKFDRLSEQLVSRGYERLARYAIEDTTGIPLRWAFYIPGPNADRGYSPYTGPSGGKGAIDISIAPPRSESGGEQEHSGGPTCVTGITIQNSAS